MERTIKFRGQILNSVKDDKGNVVTEWKSWVYGDLLHRSNGVLHILTLNEEKACYENNTIDPETLGQFTGLLDKDGKEIYEGDILHTITFGFNPEEYTAIILYRNCSFQLSNGRNLFYFGQSDLTKMDDTIVIGNIYDNPDLIKEEEYGR